MIGTAVELPRGTLLSSHGGDGEINGCLINTSGYRTSKYEPRK